MSKFPAVLLSSFIFALMLLLLDTQIFHLHVFHLFTGQPVYILFPCTCQTTVYHRREYPPWKCQIFHWHVFYLFPHYWHVLVKQSLPENSVSSTKMPNIPLICVSFVFTLLACTFETIVYHSTEYPALKWWFTRFHLICPVMLPHQPGTNRS